jgi:hypothetical protein
MMSKKGYKMTAVHKRAISRGIRAAKAGKAEAKVVPAAVDEYGKRQVKYPVDPRLQDAPIQSALMVSGILASGQPFSYEFTDARDLWEQLNTVFG